MLDGYILAFYIAALSELHRYGQHQGSTWLSEDQFGSDRRKTGRGADVATSSLLTRTGPHLCTAAAERTLPYAAIALCTEANGLGWCVPNGIAKRDAVVSIPPSDFSSGQRLVASDLVTLNSAK